MRYLSQILFIIIAITIFFTVTNPLYNKISLLKEDVKTYDIAMKSSTDLLKTRDALVDVYKGIKQEDKDRLEHLLPDSVNNIQLILEIEKVARFYNMPIKDIKFEGKSLVNPTNNDNQNINQEEVNKEANLPYGVFPLEFTVDGKYGEFVSFLKDMELNLRIVDIKSVSFTVPEEKSVVLGATGGTYVDPNIYSFKIKADIYWLK